ncbi:hypothetical protein AYO20_10192 [Fonsecaea nubica]|uniref:tRNA (adenine(58)-N(1))-methyltransferase catalytic subunit TRM61 n=1 Tax=Fonsecaea nubica TaxID=856822 RepID=A0A178C846_9EURO|nr:hypothetical protein AYO20_10192 [Fonsecaea nubica]OAL26139.1 hypothetical protein AYO20_10192 [Fonsecaea nubica]
MSGVFRFLKKALGFSRTPDKVASGLQNAVERDLTRFAEGDRVLVDGSKLTFPLQRNSRYAFSKGQLALNDIIGKPVTSTYVRSSKGSLHKVELPSLEDYVTLTPRLVTPVYASYASSIVSLLDIHPEPHTANSNRNVGARRLQILEAGTGHGSLTLHLARAIAAANPPPPASELPILRRTVDKKPTQSSSIPEDDSPGSNSLERLWDEWKETRGAVLHTVEAVPANSIHAEKVVRGFRRGLYWPHVDFYTGDVKEWIARHQNSKDEFLDYVLLDMPGVHNHIQNIVPAMRDAAKLVVFVPSITQIADCVKVVRELSLPLNMDKVLELGEGISSGRKWDVRLVKPRKSTTPTTTTETQPIGHEQEPIVVSKPENEKEHRDSAVDEAIDDEEPADGETSSISQDDHPVMVCRPLVGERTFGGGFIALFRKTSSASAALDAEWRKSHTGRAKRRSR